MSLSQLIALQKKGTQGATKPAASAEQKPANPASETESTATPAPVKAQGLGGLNLARSAQQKTLPVNDAPVDEKPAPNVDKAVVESGEFTLEDLAGLDASSIESESVTSTTSDFDDEIEATAPARALEPDLTPEMLGFVETLDGLYSVLHDPEMFGQSVRIIMMELQENKEYQKLLADQDVHVMIRGMRRTMGLARVRKQEKSRKATTNKSARKKSGVSDDAMAMLDQLMGNLDG